MSLKALLFDVDGTIADTERFGHRPAYNKAFQELGLQFRWNARLYRKLLEQHGGGRERLLHYLDLYEPDLGEHAPTVADDPHEWAREVHVLKSKHFSDLLQQGRVPLRRGVARLIREAHEQGLRVALVSNASHASLKPLIRYALGRDLQASIDLVVGGDQVRHKKPDPEPYRLAMSRLGLRPEECVAIEDSEMGLQAASRAGLATVVTLTSATRGQNFAAAALLLNDLGDPGCPCRVLRGKLSGEYLTLSDLQALAVRPSSADVSTVDVQMASV